MVAASHHRGGDDLATSRGRDRRRCTDAKRLGNLRPNGSRVQPAAKVTFVALDAQPIYYRVGGAIILVGCVAGWIWWFGAVALPRMVGQ